MISMGPVQLSRCKEEVAAILSKISKRCLHLALLTPTPGMLRHWEKLPHYSSTTYNGMKTGVCLSVLQKRDPTLAHRAGKASAASLKKKREAVREEYAQYVEVEVSERVNDYCGVISKADLNKL